MKILLILVTWAMIILTNIIIPGNRNITVTVLNATSDEGNISFALYDKTNFLIKPIQVKKAKIVEGKSIITFDNIEPGEYAVVCYHDKNENGTMDFQPNGMPLEEYGASNNIISYGPPEYHNAKFEILDKDVSLDIKF